MIVEILKKNLIEKIPKFFQLNFLHQYIIAKHTKIYTVYYVTEDDH